MSPREIAKRAAWAGLDLVALTDHNTARNAPAFAAACREEGLAAVYGCEVSTSEEVHVLALFADHETAVGFGDEVYAALSPVANDPERFGDQVVVNEREEIVEMLGVSLIGATSITLTELGRRIHRLGGLFVPAHVDRTAFSIWSQLGFLPPDDYDALEVTGPNGRIDPAGHAVVATSDAHRPSEIGCRYTVFEASAAAFEGLRAALAAGLAQARFNGPPTRG